MSPARLQAVAEASPTKQDHKLTNQRPEDQSTNQKPDAQAPNQKPVKEESQRKVLTKSAKMELADSTGDVSEQSKPQLPPEKPRPAKTVKPTMRRIVVDTGEKPVTDTAPEF